LKGIKLGSQSNYALRLPSSLKAGAEVVARQDGTTLNQFIVSAVAEKLSALKTSEFFIERANSGNLNSALALLSRVGGQVPIDDDQLPEETCKD
jgi:hypothetical protein